jgi:Ca2+-binding EF-hand superfamily protein
LRLPQGPSGSDGGGCAQQLPGSQCLTPGELRRLHGAFTLHDADADGLLQRHELVEAVSSCGYDSEEVEEMLEGRVGAERATRGLSFQEFVALVDDRAAAGGGA